MNRILKTGDRIDNTQFCVGDTVNFTMSYKSFDGTILKVPNTEWKIKNVSKNLYSKSAIIYNEKSKAYYKIPLENLIKKLRKIEKSKTLNQSKDFPGNEKTKDKWLKNQHQKILLSDNSIANGDYVIDGEITIRIKNGYLNDVEGDDGSLLPAISTADSSHIEHWKNGVLHCEKGPAVIDSIDGYEEWWFNGKQVEEAEK
ncbi:MAG: hypothetical protein ACFNKL_07730 [Treponema sp.]